MATKQKTTAKKTTKKTATKKITKKTTTKKTTKKTSTKKTKTKSIRTKTVCLSHKEDADGISSAALIKQAFGGDSILEDYPSLMESIRIKCKEDEKIKIIIYL